MYENIEQAAEGCLVVCHDSSSKDTVDPEKDFKESLGLKYEILDKDQSVNLEPVLKNT